MASNRIPQVIRTKLGDDATFGLIELLDSEEKRWSEHVLTTATDRFERRLTDEISQLRREFYSALHDGLAAIRTELATTRAAERIGVPAT